MKNFNKRRYSHAVFNMVNGCYDVEGLAPTQLLPLLHNTAA